MSFEDTLKIYKSRPLRTSFATVEHQPPETHTQHGVRTMLVDQDALIQQNNGVATVWLMSTIGARSTTRKITRKEIQGVSIPQTCQAIKQPPQGTTLTLRVSSSLLYGVAVVYRQKADYLSSDAQTIRTRIQRDILSLKAADKHLIEPPVIHMPPSFSVPFFHLKNSSSGERGQVLFNDDPLFHIEDGMLPSLEELEFLVTQPTQPDQKQYETKCKQLIRAHDLANNTISHVVSHITSTEDEESGLFSQKPRGILKDELDSVSEPQFAFNDDGMLLDLGGMETSASGPAGGGTEIDFEMNDGGGGGDLDFDFPEDMERVPRETPEVRSRSGSVRPEFEQVLEEIGEKEENGEEVIVQVKAKKTNKRKRRTDGAIPVTIDEIISISTDELRQYRDNYVSIMSAKKKKKTNSNKSITVRLAQIRRDMNTFNPLIGAKFFNPYNSGIAPMEERRGRDPTRRVSDLNDDDDDFVSGLFRRRRSSSIETGRNMSSSRRNSGASISGVPLNFDQGQQENQGGGDFFDYDFDDVLGANGGDSTSGASGGNSTSSRKRSSGTPSAINKFGPVVEDEEMGFNDYGLMDGGTDNDRVPLGPEDQNQRDQDDVVEGNLPKGTHHYDITTARFLSFIEFRFEDEPTKELMTFRELLGQDYFDDFPPLEAIEREDKKRRAAVAGSFYSVLQLATHAQIDVVNDNLEIERSWKLGGPDDFSIKLRA